MSDLTREEKDAVDDGIARLRRKRRAGDIDGLLEELDSKPQIPMQGLALIALGRIGDARAAEQIAERLAHDEDFSRIDALVALGRIGAPEGHQPLLAGLEHQDRRVRIMAAGWVGRLGLREGRQALIRILDSDDASERFYAADALASVGEPGDEPLLREARKREPRFFRRRRYPRTIRASR